MHVDPQEWLQLFVFHDQALAKTTRDLSDDQWLARAGDANNAHWILGHLACCRRRGVEALGQARVADQLASMRVARWQHQSAKPAMPHSSRKTYNRA